jgi:hypothetical protein
MSTAADLAQSSDTVSLQVIVIFIKLVKPADISTWSNTNIVNSG